MDSYFECECRECGAEWQTQAVELDSGDVLPRQWRCPLCGSRDVKKEEFDGDGEFDLSRRYVLVEAD